MSTPPSQPKIYHITHVDNLPDIIARGGLMSDAEMCTQGGPAKTIGMSNIKRRRSEDLTVDCHPGTKVGDFVPFYFSPRSIMLYVIYRGNHPELTYHSGQGPIVHLEADLHAVVDWANAHGRPWAFSLTNAGASYAEFCCHVNELDQLDWVAIAARDFRNPDVKEAKQAEFLLHEHFPFDLIERIGVQSASVQERAAVGISEASHRPPIEIRSDWYF